MKNISLVRFVCAFVLVFSAVFSGCLKRRTGGESKVPTSKIDATSAAKIINGRDVTTKDIFAKHIVGIVYKGDTMCTGVIIAKNAILTAAHCAEDLKKSKVSFGFNKKQLQFRDITNFIAHKEYEESIIEIDTIPANDILVLKFRGELPAGYEPAEISDQDLVQNNAVVTISGYGRDEANEYDVLKVTEAPVVQSAAYEFRTDEKKTGSCDGDSGGPVFLKNSDDKYMLVGAVSRGDQYCHQFGIYENVTYYKTWINESVQKLESQY